MDAVLLPTIGLTAPIAIGLAVSPFPIIGMVLALMSDGGRTRGTFLLLGRLVGLAVVFGVVIGAADAIAALTSSVSLPSVVRVIVGAGLVVLGIIKWRPKPGGPAGLPGWMTALETARPGKAFALGFLLSVANPKELGLIAAIGVTIGGSGLTIAQEIVVALAAIVVACLTILAPLLASVFAPRWMQPRLGAMRGWLERHNTKVMGALLVVIGAIVAGGALLKP